MTGGRRKQSKDAAATTVLPRIFSWESYRMLQEAIKLQEREFQKLIKCKHKLSSRELKMKYTQRRECVLHIQAMHNYFDPFASAVLATSISIMDSVLMTINISKKYLGCFSAACFFIGSKWVEDSCEPTAPVLTCLHAKQWKEVDLTRMEAKVLEILNWEIPRCTYLNFLPLMLKVIPQCQTCLLPSSQILKKAEVCLLQDFSFLFRPSALALGILGHCLQQSGICSTESSLAFLTLQDAVQVLDSELHEIGQLLKVDSLSWLQGIPKCNKEYFPKVFKSPSDNFILDNRLYNIKEEDSEFDSGLATTCNLFDSSFSDFDYSEDDSDEFS